MRRSSFSPATAGTLTPAGRARVRRRLALQMIRTTMRIILVIAAIVALAITFGVAEWGRESAPTQVTSLSLGANPGLGTTGFWIQVERP